MTSDSLPKPSFLSADETSLTLSCSTEFSSLVQSIENGLLRLQYKKPHEDWTNAKYIHVQLPKDKTTSQKGNVKVDVRGMSIEDLDPGTPYCVRFILCDESESVVQYGPETVFDTAPVDCGPKKKSCIIS